MNTMIDGITPLIHKHSPHSYGRDIEWLMLSNGAADINDNVIFFGFEDASPEPAFVAKAPRLPSNAWIVQTEHERLVEIWERLGDEAANYVPKPVVFSSVDGLPVLVISYVRGDGFLYSNRKKFWQKPARVQMLTRDAAHSLRKLHNKISVPLEDNEQVHSDFFQKIDTFNEFFAPSNEERQTLSELTARYLSQTSSYKTIIQGDFWHGNIIRNAVQDNLILVDWQYARWSTDVSLDVYLFLLAGALALTKGTDAERARSTLKVLIQWQQEIIPTYLDTYGTPNNLSLLPFKYGMLLCCVEKSVRTILDFGYNQSGSLAWRYLFSEFVNQPSDGFFNVI